MTAATRATNDLIRDHLPFVALLVREAMTRLPTHVDRDDLTSAGMFALVTSARAYDPERGIPFHRFAAIRIRGALADELRTMDWATRSVRAKARELDATRASLTAELGRPPRPHEIAAALGLSINDLDAVDADVQRATVLSLQALTTDDTADPLPTDGTGPEQLLVHREQLGMLADAVAELPPRLRLVIEEYFFKQRKMTDIGADLGVSESRISQMRSEALALLRAGMHACDPGQPIAGATKVRRTPAVDAYCAAVATRSSLAHRLNATTTLGETRKRDHARPNRKAG